MAHKGPLWLDPSKQATEHLNEILGSKHGTTDEEIVVLDEKLKENLKPDEEGAGLMVPDMVGETPGPSINVHDARKEAPLLEESGDRQRVRLLLITKDATIAQEGSASYRRIIDQRNMFLEIHIVLINSKTGEGEVPVTRFFENVWLYTTNSSSWWMQGYDAYKLSEAQLVFGGGFRADLIVAEDPFESGLAGWFLSEKYERTFQLHIYEDFFDKAFVESQEHPTIYEWAVRYLLGRAGGVRTHTELPRQAALARHTEPA